jgi:hypothetical protein
MAVPLVPICYEWLSTIADAFCDIAEELRFFR